MPLTNARNDDSRDMLVRIDARTEALPDDVREIKDALPSKADTERVARIESRQEKSDTKLNYVIGGILALEALLKLVH